MTLKLPEVPLGNTFGSQASRQAVENLPNVIELYSFVQVQEGDPEPAAGEKLYEPFLLQFHQGFAQRRSTDSKLGSELDLTQTCS
jgi:hypothetical protein